MSDNVSITSTGKVTVLLSENGPELIAKVLDIQKWNLATVLAKLDN